MWQENWRADFTCVYLLSVVDQKNLISRHERGRGREGGAAYKNCFYFTYQISGIRSHGNKTWTRTWKTHLGLEHGTKNQNTPHAVCGTRCTTSTDSIVLYTGWVVLPLLNASVGRVRACSAKMGAVGVCVSLAWGCHSEAPWGQVLSASTNSTKTPRHESHLQSWATIPTRHDDI